MQIQNEIIDLEKRYWQAMAESDVETATSLTRFPAIVSGPRGTNLVTETEYREMMAEHTGNEFRDIELKNPKVEFVNDDLAILSYETMVRDMKMSDVSTWIRENDKWVCAFHSENPLQ